MRTLCIYVFASLAMVTFWSAASAKHISVTHPIVELDVHSSARGNFYLLSVDVPEDIIGKRLDSVILEFVVDVSANSVEDSVVTPTVCVFPLSLAFRGDAAGSRLVFDSDVASARPVAIGEDQRIAMDITDIIRGWMKAPTTNRGLVIGTLVGPAVGTITVKSTGLGSGTAVRVTFYYQNRFGERVSTN